MFRLKRGYFGKYLTSLFTIADIALVNLLFAATLLLCPELAHSPKIRILWVLVNVCYLPAMLLTTGKPHQLRVMLMEHVVRTAFGVVGVHALFFFSLVAFLEIDDIPLRGYLIFYGMMAVAVPVWWIVSRQIIKTMRRKGYNFTRVVIVGTGPTAMRLMDELHSDAGFGYHTLGFVSDDPDPAFKAKGKLLGTINDLDALAKKHNIDQVFYTLSGTNEKELLTVIKIADDNMMQFYYVPQISRHVTRSLQLHNVGVVPVLSVRRNPLNNILNRFVKRAFDIVFSSVCLIFSPLVFIPVAIAIKISSPGPIFFTQERTGYRGKTFKCFKFRTMRVNASANSKQATKDDDRTTKVGQFLRRTSIDELPQFINVFLGDMSVVGPRPHMLKHTQDYAKLIDVYMVRHAVKPGITGWAQVNGYRGITDQLWKMEKRVEHDVWYIENWSFLLDMKIIVRTVINAMSKDENAF